MARHRATRIDRARRNGHTGVAPLFALQSAIGNRASAALMREAATSSSSTASQAKAGNKHAYITIEGTKQGKFKGSSNIKGREDAIEISSYKLAIKSPRDAGSGLPTGKRQYQAISFKKAVDASSPQFMQALTSNEVLKSVVISFYGPAQDGRERVYQTVTLTNATLSAWSQDFESGDDMENVELVFENIQLESNTGGTAANDSWAQPTQ
jgi:type VI secretion system secreted protein Hcp